MKYSDLASQDLKVQRVSIEPSTRPEFDTGRKINVRIGLTRLNADASIVSTAQRARELVERMPEVELILEGLGPKLASILADEMSNRTLDPQDSLGCKIQVT